MLVYAPNKPREISNQSYLALIYIFMVILLENFNK